MFGLPFYRAGKLHLQNQGMEQLEAYQGFWERLTDLKAECEDNVLSPVNDYCFSITKLLEPSIKEKVDKLALEISQKTEPDYDFTSIHDAKENLFVYKLGVNEKDLLGFVGFIPHLTNLQRKMCYFITKLGVEKE